MLDAAGIAYVSPEGQVLFLRRSRAGDHAGEWGWPGGKVEAGESHEDAARRESAEEIGREPLDELEVADRRESPEGVRFVTFRQNVGDIFDPELDDEHDEYAWRPLDDPPRPLHPGVEATLSTWRGAQDRLALDRASVRRYDADGRLHVAASNISKAAINPYLGKEIPDWQNLGIDPDKIYKLLRDPDELSKAAPTFNNLPLLAEHVPVSAVDHRPELVIGSTGTDASFVSPFLRNSLVIWAKPGIDAVESETQKELSSAYRYRADMTPGSLQGEHYDGVMRDIVGNHVALVREGRAGPDVVVGDAALRDHKQETTLMKPTRLAALTLGLTAAAIAPLIAADKKLELPKSLFAGLTTKNIAQKKTELMSSVRAAADGKLRKGLALDASMAHVGKVLDSIASLYDGGKGGDESVSEEQHNAMEAAAHGESELGIPKKVGKEFADKDEEADDDADNLGGETMDDGIHEQIRDFLAGKLSEEDMAQLESLMGAHATGAADEPPGFEGMPKPGAKSAKDKKLGKDKKGAKDASEVAGEAETDKTKGEAMISKGAMDKAITTAVEAGVKAERERQRDLRDAEKFVRPWLGELGIACDSAEQVYRHTLKALGVDAEGVHPSALQAILKAQPQPGAKPQREPRIGMDQAAVKSFADRFPGAARINVQG